MPLALVHIAQTNYDKSDLLLFIVIIRDGTEPKPSRNLPNQNPGLAKSPRTEPNPKVKNVQEPEPYQPYPIKNRTEPEPKCRGSYSVLSLNETVGTFTHFIVNEAFYFT